MPVKRRVAKVRENRITPDAVAAFLAEDRPALHRALGLKPWEISPLDANGDAPPAWMDARNREEWRKAQILRAKLEKAAR